MGADGHRDSFGPPEKGWPTFGPNGEIVDDHDDEEETDEGVS